MAEFDAEGAGISFDYAEVNGVRLHYARKGGGRAMVFVHGFPDFWYTWRHQLVEFGQDHLAVAPDMRGFNLSSKPKGVGEYRPQFIVEDLRQFIRAMGQSSCVLVAHDWGGAIAWNFAIAHPDMVEKLVILNAPHPALFARDLKSNPDQIAGSQYMNFFRMPQAAEKLARDDYAMLWRFSFGSWDTNGVVSAADKAAYLEAWSQPGALEAGLNWYKASPLRPPNEDGGYDGPPPPDLDPADFRVRVPTCVIWGMNDTALRPSLLDGLDDIVEDLTLHRIEGAGHWVFHQEPDRINRIIREFLAK